MDFSTPMGGLFTEPRAAVLSVLARSGVPLTGRQVHARVAERWSLRAVQSALAGLARLGMIDQERVGRAITHVLNRDHYTVPYLEALLSPTTALREMVEGFFTDIGADDRQLRGIWLFGSVARGEATATSDIDVALVVSGGDWSEAVVALSDLIRRRLGNDCDVVVVEADRLVWPVGSEDALAASVLRDAITLAGDDVSTVARAGVSA